MNAMTNEETDTALILENELRRRVNEIVAKVVHAHVQKEFDAQFSRYKEHMIMEISISVGRMLKVIEEEGRTPLWEATPEEFGMAQKDLRTHMHVQNSFDKELPNALHQNPPSV